MFTHMCYVKCCRQIEIGTDSWLPQLRMCDTDTSNDYIMVTSYTTIRMCRLQAKTIATSIHGCRPSGWSWVCTRSEVQYSWYAGTLSCYNNYVLTL